MKRAINLVGLLCLALHAASWASYIVMAVVLPGHRAPEARDGCYWAEPLFGPGVVCANETLNVIVLIINGLVWTWTVWVLTLLSNPRDMFLRLLDGEFVLGTLIGITVPITLCMALLFGVPEFRRLLQTARARQK